MCTSSTTPQADVISVTRSIKINSPSVLWFLNLSQTILSENAILTTAISFFLSLSAGFSSPVFTSMVCSISVTIPGIDLVPSLKKKFFPLKSSSSSIQSIVAVMDEATFAPEPIVSTQPLDTSTSLSSWIVTGWPVNALSLSLSPTWMLFTWAVSLLGSVVISSPTFTSPASICPWKPRKVWSGRQTLCTGMKKPSSSFSSFMSTSSRYDKRAGPLYHGIFSDFVVTLSPSVAETGMITTFLSSSSFVSSTICFVISSKRFSS